METPNFSPDNPNTADADPLGLAPYKTPPQWYDTGAPDLNALSDEDLAALAAKRGIAVTGTGEGGAVVRGDLIAALEAK